MPTQINNTALCDAGDSTLLIVDVQTKLTAAMPAKVLARMQRNIQLLLRAAEILSVPTHAFEQYPQGLGPLEPEIAKALPADCARHEKTAFSCCGAEQFPQALAAGKRKQAVICGMEAHVCVMQTALDLRAADYQVFVAADAICSRNRENYETALHRLRAAGIAVCDTESVLFEWLRDAKNERFKSVHTLLT